MKTKLLPIIAFMGITATAAPLITSCSCNQTNAIKLDNFIPLDPDWEMPFLMNKEPLEYTKDEEYTIEADLSKWTGDSYANKYWELITIVTAKYKGVEERNSMPLKSYEAKIDSKELKFIKNPASPLGKDEFSYETDGNSHLLGGVGALNSKSKIWFKIVIDHSVIEEFDLKDVKVSFALTFEK